MQDRPSHEPFAERILVPFPVESDLSGVGRYIEHFWYRVSFTVPPEWAKQTLLLHFGAVDWRATVYVNGMEVGMHQGGYGTFLSGNPAWICCFMLLSAISTAINTS